MRTAFIEQLIEEAENNDRIFLIVGDLGFSVVEDFQEKFPDRFLNAGVAEQNMVGIASGLASEGYNVFIYSIGNFPTLRCMEQIRYDICYHNKNVKIVAVGGGYSYGPLGVSHHATEELGMLRTIPNLIVCAPGDPLETKMITSAFSKIESPCYLRLGKAGEPLVHFGKENLVFGNINEIIKGQSVAVLTTGSMLYHAYTLINNGNMKYGLYSVPCIKPLDFNGLVDIANQYSSIITLEEHQRSAGFGSAVLEGYNDLIEAQKIYSLPRIKRVAIPDKFISVAGSQNYIRDLVGLTIEPFI